MLNERGAVAEEASVLTTEMLKQGTWKNKKFRAYNISLNPPRQGIGRKHPYKEFLDFVKYKFIGMGFEEMRGPLVENEFWDMDALFMPQFHPARNIHDVYFVKEPAACREIEQPFARRVAAAHRDGGKTGSTGWRYNFDVERAKRLILRSQGTAVSARTLASGPRIPGKYFSIARCFRYDAVDATHAPDFYQVEGIVLGEEIDFKALLGLLKLFGQEIAKAGEFQFRPAYFPFTEPSVELHVKHPELGWMELGGRGSSDPRSPSRSAWTCRSLPGAWDSTAWPWWPWESRIFAICSRGIWILSGRKKYNWGKKHFTAEDAEENCIRL